MLQSKMNETFHVYSFHSGEIYNKGKSAINTR